MFQGLDLDLTEVCGLAFTIHLGSCLLGFGGAFVGCCLGGEALPTRAIDDSKPRKPYDILEARVGYIRCGHGFHIVFAFSTRYNRLQGPDPVYDAEPETSYSLLLTPEQLEWGAAVWYRIVVSKDYI